MGEDKLTKNIEFYRRAQSEYIYYRGSMYLFRNKDRIKSKTVQLFEKHGDELELKIKKELYNE